MIEQLGIRMLRFELPFRLNHVNCFLAEGDKGWTAIDAGIHSTVTEEMWQAQLKNKKLENILITHSHPDHIGYAGTLQQKTGASVAMTKVEAAAAEFTWSEPFLALTETNYKKADVPEQLTKEIIADTVKSASFVQPFPRVDNYIQPGDSVQLGKYTYKVLAAPGHADGMICFYNKEKSVLLAADHILPRISPNISYWFHGDDNPLQSYLHSLSEIKKLSIDYVIPSHGKPFFGANERIDEMISHHQERLEVTLEQTKTESTVFDVCNELFQFSLTTHEARFAIGEAVAHLEYLRKAGECERIEREGKWYYRAVTK